MLIYLGVYIVYQITWEVVIINFLKGKLKIFRPSLYLIVKMITGVMAKTLFLAMIVLADYLSFISDPSSDLMAVLLITCAVISQIYPIITVFKNFKTTETNLLPALSRNEQLSWSTGHFGVHLIFEKLSIEPSELSKHQRKKILTEFSEIGQIRFLEQDRSNDKEEVDRLLKV